MAAIKPDYRVIAVDESNAWDPSIIAITGRMAGVYIVDFSTLHHICSLSGSYEARFLRNISEHYVREPDGYEAGAPIWDAEWIADNPEAHARSVALVAAWNGSFYGIANEGAEEEWNYFDERSLNPENGSAIDMTGAGWDADPAEMEPDDAERYRRERDEAAYEAAREYESNGEEWEDLAPWNREKAA